MTLKRKNKNGTMSTRRQVLTRIALAGGSVPLVKAMAILGIGQISAQANARSQYDPVVAKSGIGTGKKVAIIGAGLSGLTAAYELSLLGYECKIFEADNRPKGRTFTIRPDGSSDSWYQEAGKDSEGKQREAEVCTFNEADGKGSLYFEAGAGRIPTHHTTVLDYCKKFGVALESFIFASRANLMRSDNFNQGEPVPVRHFKHNLRGYLAEMFRTANAEQLDGVMTPEEFEKLADVFGELKEGTYQGGARAGYEVGPGAGNNSGELYKPFAFADLLKAKTIWNTQLFNDMRHYWQTSLVQPVGGIDNIAAAFMRQATPAGAKVGNLIHLSRKVVEIKMVTRRGRKVIVKTQHVDHLGKPLSKKNESFEADFCISTIAPSLLAKVKNNFDDKFQDALTTGVHNVAACKVAWQAERFWESSKNGIYGGISWTSDPISQIWYPSTGFHNQRGILTGAYLRDDPTQPLADTAARPATRFGKLSHNSRVAQAWEQGRKLHAELDPSARNEQGNPYNMIDKAMTIAWQNMPFQAGGWFTYTDDQRKEGYQVMLAGQKNMFFMAGDAMSYIPGWMEGALTAGLRAKAQVENATVKEKIEAAVTL